MKTKMLILTALFAALTAVGAFIRIPFLYSAFTLHCWGPDTARCPSWSM